MPQTPTFAAAIKRVIDSRIAGAFVALPGRVESYADGRADVKPLIKFGYHDESGERQAESLPVIPDVPVVFPGAGGVRVKFPIARGDTVLLVFCSSSIDRWLALDKEVDPEDDRHHSLSDAIAIPGLQATYSENSPLIEFVGDEIHAGGSEALAKASELEQLRSTIGAALTGDAIPTAVNTLGPYGGTSVLKGS